MKLFDIDENLAACVKKDPELDKVAVKKAIKAGETVPGCELVARQNLQIK